MEENKDNINNEPENSMFSADNTEDSSLFSQDSTENTVSSDDIDGTEKKISEEASDISEGEVKKDDIIDVEEINKTSDSQEETTEKTVKQTDDAFGETQNLKEKEQDDLFGSKDDSTGLDSNPSDNAGIDDSLVTVRPVKFQHFDDIVSNLSIKKNLDIMQDIPMHITVELGRTKSSIKDIVSMNIGSIVELDKVAGEQVEIFVNEKLVARGEVIVIEDKFGVRVVNTNIPKEIV